MDALRRRIVIASKLVEARAVEDEILDHVGRLNYDDSAVFGIKLALEEGLNNAIKHGNACDPARTVEVVYDVSEKQLEVTITDEGHGFQPDDVPDPTADENLEKPSGRGIMLMRAYMDEVEYNKRGNRLRLVKRKS